MNEGATAQEYLQVQVMTSSKDQLLLLLLDGAVRFVEGARDRLAEGKLEEKHLQLVKAQNIVLELLSSLSPDVGDKIYTSLVGLYKFIYNRLVTANLRNDAKSLAEALRILHTVRAMWRDAVSAFHSSTSGGAPAEAGAPVPPTGAGLSLQA